MKETRVLMSKMPESPQSAVVSHRQLVEALKARDAQKAEEAMRLHMENGARYLAMALQQNSTPKE